MEVVIDDIDTSYEKLLRLFRSYGGVGRMLQDSISSPRCREDDMSFKVDLLLHTRERPTITDMLSELVRWILCRA